MLYDMIGVIDLGGDCQGLVQKIRALGVYSLAFSGADAELAQKLSGAVGLVLAGGKAADAEMFEQFSLPTLQVTEGEQAGDKLAAFIGTCGTDRSWNMENYAKETIEAIKAQVGDGKVLLALSGGVDSSVCAALIERAVGSQLSCIFVDTGLMRKNEADEVQAAFAGKGLHYIRIEGEERFLGKLAGVTDPEQKRKIIGEEFIRVFEEEAKMIGRVDFLAQGTIYADILESGIGAKHVKSHHNVGGLPEHVDFKEIIEPLRTLFKHEVRELGTVLGLPEELSQRQPFPGPGLGVRVIGELKKERLDTLREADYIFRTEMKNAGLHREVAQYFAVLTDMQSVGVRDGGRTYESTLALRAIHTGDYMTGRWAHLPHELLELVSTRIVTEVPGINRVVYDITSKPPATIEWE